MGISLLVLLLLLAAALTAGLLFANSLLDKVDRTEESGNEFLSESEVYTEEPTFEETTPPETIEQIEDDFQQAQQQQPTILDDPDIQNILLIGSDRRSTKENGRADSMMILSVNHKTKKIHIVSLMRAMYVCIPKSSGDVWGMLNAAYSWGGPKLLIATIEKNFRIDIDNYVSVDFSSFEKAIDLAGGVRVTLTRAEANYIKIRTSFLYTSAGTYTLNGEQALCYARIRKLDDDFKRTGRQRTVIIALLQQAKGLSVNQLIEMADQILPSVKTDMSNGEIMEYLLQAPTLLSYEISQRMLPIENENGSYTGKIYVNKREMYKVNFTTNIPALHEFLKS